MAPITGQGVSFAQFVNDLMAVGSDVIIPLLIALAFVSFLYGMVRYYFIYAGNEEKRASGRAFMLWGIVGLVILLTAWGLVHSLLAIFNLTPS